MASGLDLEQRRMVSLWMKNGKLCSENIETTSSLSQPVSSEQQRTGRSIANVAAVQETCMGSVSKSTVRYRLECSTSKVIIERFDGRGTIDYPKHTVILKNPTTNFSGCLRKSPNQLKPHDRRTFNFLFFISFAIVVIRYSRKYDKNNDDIEEVKVSGKPLKIVHFYERNFINALKNKLAHNVAPLNYKKSQHPNSFSIELKTYSSKRAVGIHHTGCSANFDPPSTQSDQVFYGPNHFETNFKLEYCDEQPDGQG
ncbi:hypothetical protein FQA39_LY09846 [Lamprigera yunnana]|nr:hypothetical protein FQA39_LY09846 [Lamprigera yunnana]